MEIPDWLTEAQRDEIMASIAAAVRYVVLKQADACRQAIRNHQQPPVMFEEGRNAVLLI